MLKKNPVEQRPCGGNQCHDIIAAAQTAVPSGTAAMWWKPMSRHHCRCPNSCTQWNSGHVVETNVTTSLPLPKQLYTVEQRPCGGNQCHNIIATAQTAVPSGTAVMWWKPMSRHHCRCPNSCTQWNSSHVVETNVKTSLPLPKQLYPVEQQSCGGNKCPEIIAVVQTAVPSGTAAMWWKPMSRHHCRCPNSCTQWNSGHVVETNVTTSLPLPKQLYPVEQQSCGGNQCPDIIAAAQTAVPSGTAAMWWKPMSRHHCLCQNSCIQWNSGHVVETNVTTSLPLPKQLYPVEQRPCGGNQCHDIIATAQTAVPSGTAVMRWKPMSRHHCHCPNSCTQWNSSHVVETNVQTSLPLPKQLYPVEQLPCGGNQCLDIIAAAQTAVPSGTAVMW